MRDLQPSEASAVVSLQTFKGEITMKQLSLIIAVATCAFLAGCASYSERVVEKPAPARTVVYETAPAPVPAQTTTTVYTTR